MDDDETMDEAETDREYRHDDSPPGLASGCSRRKRPGGGPAIPRVDRKRGDRRGPRYGNAEHWDREAPESDR